MRIRYARRAVNDLESIREYLSKRDPSAGVSVLAAIYAAVEFIRRYPEVAEVTRIHDIRAKVVQRYRFRVFYRIVAAEDVIEIVHVRHTSRRPWLGET